VRVATPIRLVLIGLALLGGALLGHRSASRLVPADAVLLDGSRDTVQISDAQRAAGLTFAPGVSSADRAWILRAIASARPEAQRLIAEVDGLTTFVTDPRMDPHVMGLTQAGPSGYRISLNIGYLDGERAIDRNVVVLHELGHVIDFALIPRALDARLDAGIPRGTSCGGTTRLGACAAPAERIADTFAKWALGGAVSQVGAGYGIPNPPSLEDWGAPLLSLGGPS
jgi:hypothetical protein